MKREVARALLEIGAVGFSLEHPITFKSGILSPVYVDNRRLPYHPQQWHTIIEGFRELLNESGTSYDILAGVAVGGVPHSSALAYALRVPSVFVRKEAKGHGKGQRVEGGDVRGKRVILIEDLVTTGSSSLSGVHALREAGAVVEDIYAIVQYGFEQAQRSFQDAKLNLHTLTSFAFILSEALAAGFFNEQQKVILEDWFTDPHGWARRQGL